MGALLRTISLCVLLTSCGGASAEETVEDPTKPPGYVPPSAPTPPPAHVMTSAIVDAEGTRTYALPPERVFAAARGALLALGYEVVFADEQSGVIKTQPKATLTLRNENGSYSRTYGGFGGSYHGTTTSTNYAHSYSVTVAADAKGVRVRAAPRMFINGDDVSGTPVWDLPIERDRWAQLFREIGSNLGTQ